MSLQPNGTPDRISVSIGKKINTGNYESVDLHVSISTDVDPKRTIEQEFGIGFVRVTRELNRQIRLLGKPDKVLPDV